MSTGVLKALHGKLDVKRRSTSILYVLDIEIAKAYEKPALSRSISSSFAAGTNYAGMQIQTQTNLCSPFDPQIICACMFTVDSHDVGS